MTDTVKLRAGEVVLFGEWPQDALYRVVTTTEGEPVLRPAKPGETAVEDGGEPTDPRFGGFADLRALKSHVAAHAWHEVADDPSRDRMIVHSAGSARTGS